MTKYNLLLNSRTFENRADDWPSLLPDVKSVTGIVVPTSGAPSIVASGLYVRRVGREVAPSTRGIVKVTVQWASQKNKVLLH